ncbi:phosphotransferase [candidate division TA06 bacterium]|uniref:Phosphotransferase n=1 Tax=candidate division TA06 bacterium TaxID=2250710 RepID=A0A523XLZ8_UNCT6|nr:MAG: phosphotransferase [candidate division TA06 bacterium]
MKKIDLHIHTVPALSDSPFTFDLTMLIQYVSEAALDAIAITNHDIFDRPQYETIAEALNIVVFPGLEVTLDCGHLLIIGNITNLDTFDDHARQVSARITQLGDSISVDELIGIFRNLDESLVIPHYDKRPAIKREALEPIASYVSAGEVDSAKKFIRAIKDETKPTPVLFSDVRISENMTAFPTRQTFVDCGELTLRALKTCLQDKGKVALSETHGNRLFQVLDDGQMLSTGLNVLLGERSTGKTYTLDRINASHDNVKYIRQFSLVQQDDAACAREFSEDLKRTRSQFIEEFLSGFKVVLNDVMNVDLRADERAVEDYLSTLLEAAEEVDRRDAFSNTALFHETEFPISEDKVLIALIGSVRQVIENVEYREIIVKHVDVDSLKRLAVELIELLWEKKLDGKKKRFVNGLVRDIQAGLRRRTSAVQVQDVDLYKVSLNERKVERFSEIVKCLQEEATISEESIQGFRILATKGSFGGAGELKSASGIKTAFREAFEQYERTYAYLQMLLDKEDLSRSELYKLFTKITYRILNADGFEVSGGERSEFRLLQEIKDAQNYDMLLLDEPESSFDNMFLRSDVNRMIKEVSQTMPVVVVTHNSTVGASVGADYLLYASKEIEGNDVVYRVYAGHPTDLSLHSVDGKTINNYLITLNTLEAGQDAYDDRRRRYEALKNRR